MLSNMLRESAKKHAEKTAIVYDNLRVSYKELYDNVSGLSKGLRSLDIKQGNCLALILPSCPEFITGFYAAAKLNATLLLVNPALAEAEIKHYISDSEAVAIITDSLRTDACRNIIAEADKKIDLIVTGKNTSPDICFSDLVKDGEFDDKEDIFEGDVVYQYSSGSTGRPKRVVRTQKNLYYEASNFHSTVNTSFSDNILCIVPLFHAHGLGNCMLAATYSGATLTILEDLKKNGETIKVPFVLRQQRVLELVEKENITILPGVPFIFRALADTPNDYQVDTSKLRLVFSAGNFLPKETFDKFTNRFGIPLRQLYGCTEAGSFAINLEQEDEIHFDSVGRPMNNNEVKIVDDNGNPLPNGTIGEIAIKSLALTRGYCNMPELNEKAFRAGFFLTGDLGKKDEKGNLYITGRKKIFIETVGNKVDPIEVEDVLVTHPKVKEAVVVGIKCPFKGETIKAVIVPHGECQEREIFLYCKDRLADFKIPRIIEFREAIPKSPLGKILRKDLI